MNMKWWNTYSLALCALLSVFTINAQAATYEATELLFTPLDVPASVTTISWDRTDTRYPNDDDKVLVNIGFPFTFKDIAYTQVRILTNGVLHFGANQRFHRVYQNSALPTNRADRFIAPYWDDLVDDALSSVTYGTMGTAPNRSLVVTWNNVKAYANNLRYDFQVVLYENGDIRFRYENNTANGESATIGIEVDNSDVTLYSFNNSSVRTDFDIVFKNALLALPDPIIDIRMDEDLWQGAVGEVEDRSANNLHGTVVGDALTSDTASALTGNPGTCRYGVFDGNDYINLNGTVNQNMPASFTMSAWVKIDSLPASGLKTIASKDENAEFHVTSAGQINWWWQTTSPTATRSLTSSGSISAGVWTHIAVRYQAGSQTIFINGVASGSSSYSGTPVTNNDPLQIGADQGIASRMFNGAIDEFKIFDQALSDPQMVILASESHFCQGANLGCSESFPDALSSHDDGALTLDTGISINSPDNVLQFASVSPTSNTACNSAACTASTANAVPSMSFGPFPDTSSFTTDFTVANFSSGTIGNAGQSQYDQITVNRSATLNVNTGVRTYYIDELALERNSTLNLGSGDYWVRSLTVARNVKIRVVNSGTARLFISEPVSFERDLWLNNNDVLGLTGDPSKLLIYGYSDLSFERNTRSWAGIYSETDITIGRDSAYVGGITGDNVSISTNTSISYDANSMSKLDFGSLCTAGSCILGSFNISQPSVGLACPQSRSQVSIQAVCADGTTFKTDYTGTIDLSSSENANSDFFLALSGGTSVSSVTLNGTENGAVNAYLFHKNENHDLRVTASDTGASVSSTASSGTDFRTTGFAVTGPGHFVCGDPNPSQITLTAIGQSDTGSGVCSVLSGFTGNKNLKSWFTVNYDPDSPGTADPVNTSLGLNGTNIINNVIPAVNNLSLNFLSGISTFDVTHLDSAEILGVNFSHDDLVAGTGPVEGSTSSFIVSPNTIKVSAVDLNSACALGNSNCTKFVSAGSQFDINAVAECADPSKTTAQSYQTQALQPVNLNLIKVSPTAVGSVNGSLSLTSLDFDDGDITLSQTVSEVGVFKIRTMPPTYFSQTVSSSDSDNIGRFIPDHFEISLTGAAFAPACNATFAYLDQDFSFDSAPQVRIQALNTEDEVTQNYEGSYWKLGSDLKEQSSCHGLGSIKGFCYTDNVSGTASLRAPNASQSYGADLSDVNGDVTISLLHQSFGQFQYQRPVGSNIQPFGADVQLKIELLDDDLVSGSATFSNIRFTGGSNLRQGRWKMENAFGPETHALEMKAYAEYFTTDNRFEFNGDDKCTSFSTTDFTLSPSGTGASIFDDIKVGNLGQTQFSLNSPLDLNTKENFFFSAPLVGNMGEVDVSVNLDAQPWLKYDWNGNGALQNHPKATAIFGQYRGHDRIIYWREVQ